MIMLFALSPPLTERLLAVIKTLIPWGIHASLLPMDKEKTHLSYERSSPILDLLEHS